MATERTNHTADDGRGQAHRIGSVDLASVLAGSQPFATLFLSSGPDPVVRAQLTLDRIPVPAPHAGAIIDAVHDQTDASQVFVSDATGAVTHFTVPDPFRRDMVRFGDVPAFGPLLEADQLTAHHAVVTVETDVFAVTDFDVSSTDGSAMVVFEAIDALVTHLGDRHHDLIAVVGPVAETEQVITYLSTRLPDARFSPHHTEDGSSDLTAIADDVVRSAASLAAERLTHHLADFRECRRAGLTIEGSTVEHALAELDVTLLLAHDDVERAGADDIGPIDRAVAEAIRRQVPVTMIPAVPDERGPADGLGAIVASQGVSAATTEEPVLERVAAKENPTP